MPKAFMHRNLLIWLFALLCVTGSLRLAAQAPPAGFVVFTGSRLVDVNGTGVNGTLCAQVSANGAPYSVQPGSGGTTTKPPVCTTVTSGSFSMFLPDTSLSKPLNACIALSATDNVTGADLLDAGYQCVQTTSASGSPWCTKAGTITTCNLDNYQPNLPALAVIQTGPQGLQGTQGVPGPTGPSVVGVYDVSNYCSGCSLDAQISAATTALAAFPAELTSTHPGHILNPVTLSPGHILHLKAITGFDAQITLGTGSGVECDPQLINTSALVSAYLITTTGTDNPSVKGCAVSGYVGSNDALVNMASVTHPKVLYNTMLNGGLIYGVHMTDVDIEHNWNNGGNGININDVDRGTVAHNYTDGSPNNYGGIVVFNADADPSHFPAGFVWPDALTKGHLTIDDNYEINVQTCTFLSDVKATLVTNSHCHSPSDIGLDDEGGVDNLWQGGEAMDCAGNYCVGGEFETRNVKFDHIKVEALNGHILLVAANNNNSLGQNITFNDIDGSCSGADALCSALPVYGYSLPVTIQNSTFHNSTIGSEQQAQSSTLIFKNNLFFFNFSAAFGANTANAFTAIDPCQGSGGCINSSTIIFDSNKIFGVNVPAGSTGIYLHHYDFNSTSLYLAEKNTVFGFTNGFTHSGDSQNRGATFIMHDNLTDGFITTGGVNAYFEGFHNCQSLSNCDMNVSSLGVGTTTPNTFNGGTVTDAPTIQTTGRIVTTDGEIHIINPSAPANRQAWRLKVDGNGVFSISQCNVGYTNCPASQTYAPTN